MSEKKVAAINDLSGLGRCSLTAAIPVLSVLGVQPVPLPTAVLSNQTGFDSFFMEDFTDRIDDFLLAWKTLDLKFDAICTGFLASDRQIEKTEAFLAMFRRPETLLLVDPVMADDGEVYSTFTKARCDGIIRLAKAADMITPNLTEFCLIAGLEYHALIAGRYGANVTQVVADRALALCRAGIKAVFVTGIRTTTPAGETVLTAAVTKDDVKWIASPAFAGSYSGTGDLFAAAVCGYCLNGKTPAEAAARAIRFLNAAIADADAQQSDPLQGVPFERHLTLLTDAGD